MQDIANKLDELEYFVFSTEQPTDPKKINDTLKSLQQATFIQDLINKKASQELRELRASQEKLLRAQQTLATYEKQLQEALSTITTCVQQAQQYEGKQTPTHLRNKYANASNVFAQAFRIEHKTDVDIQEGLTQAKQAIESLQEQLSKTL